jgi:hypothetical protein
MISINSTIFFMACMAVLIVLNPILLKYDKLETLKYISIINVFILIVVLHQISQWYNIIGKVF